MAGSTPPADPKRLALWGMLGGLTFALKMAMAGLPNIEPVSLLVMLFAAVFGWRSLAAVYVYVGLEILLWGPGLWNLPYLYLWLILFAAARALRSVRSPLVWASLSGGFGLLFGALCVPVQLLAGGWAAAVSWWIAGIPWDLAHGAGNFVLALTLFPLLRRLLVRLARNAE